MQNKFSLRMKHFLALPLLLLLLAISTISQGQTITLDQADLDYAPGETVYITGTEFEAGEVVILTISHIEPGLPLIYHEHAVFNATADAEGTFTASWFVEDVELNTTLLLMAEGDQGSKASIVFTDAGSTKILFQSASITGEQSICKGSPTTLGLAINTCTNNGNGDYSIVTYRWQKSSDDINWTDADGTNNSNTYSANPDNTTYYHCIITLSNQNDMCNKNASPIYTTSSFQLTVNTGPEITTNYSNISKNNDTGECGAVVIYDAASATGIPAPTITYSQASGTLFQVGTPTTVTITASNSCGTTTKTFTVTVTDNQKPVITANGDKTVDTDAGVCGAMVSVSASATDNCSVGDPTGIRSDNLALDALYPVGTTIITWNVTDANGIAADQVFQTVTVTDNEKPVITANGDKTVDTDAGVCGAAVVVSATATDNCSVGDPTGVRSDNLALDTLYPVGTTIITWNVTDANGIAAEEVTQTVTVTDNEKPVITANGDKTVDTDAGVCGALVNVSASATDNCSVGDPTGVRSDNLALDALYPVGVTTITWNVTDANGIAADQVFQTVTVTDNEKPVITANGDKTVDTDAGVCGAAVVVSATATDNCSVGDPTGVRSDNLALDTLYPVGTTIITWNVTDANGIAAEEVTQTVTVTDNEKPVITANGDKTVDTDAGVCGALVNVSASATDNCSVGDPTGVRSDNLALDAAFPVGVTTITWNVTDANGIAADQVFQTVTVTDNEKPVITANGDKTVDTDAGVCGAAVVVSATATDNCLVGDPTGVRSDNLPLDAAFPVGVTTITWNVTDINGNAAEEVTQTVTVTDNEKPVITANGDKTVDTDAGVCGAMVSVSASATDNCSVGDPVGVRDDGELLTALYPVGTTIITWNVTDINGNASEEVTQTVTVTDNEKPVITANGDKSVDTEAGVCGAAVVVSASATDNCSVGDPTGVRSDGSALDALYPVGTTIITWNVTDINGNAAEEVTQTVTVKDNEKPVITANDNPNVFTDSGVCGAMVSVLALTTDNCLVGVPTGVRSDGSALDALYPVGTTIITWNVTDINGNAADEIFQTVVVTDNEKPVITANGDKSVDTEAGVCGAAVVVSALATDNCSVGDPTGVRSDGSALDALYPVGTTIITWNVTDINGNAAEEVTQTVIVTDNQKPVITANGDKTVNTDAGVCGAMVSVSASATDNCSVGVPTGVRSDGSALDAAFPVGVTTITWNVTDANGNAADETFQTVTVTDNEKPVITASGDKTVNTDAGVCGAMVSILASASDNCSVGDPVGVRDDGELLTALYPIGTTTITWNVTDANGNAALAVEQTVTVTNSAPIINSVSVAATPFAVNTPISLDVNYTDENVISALINWGDGSTLEPIINPSTSFSTSHTYTAAGVYTVNVNVVDACNEEASQLYQYVVVYDPAAGFVTGGGWIDSPVGASREYPDAIGKANFGFVSKYEKGKSVPTGNTEFQFKAGNLNFKSIKYEWLVISGMKAQFKGIGTINGLGNYGFILSAIDGSIDKFRIKIWDAVGTVYDNNISQPEDADPATALGGGSIVIHSNANNKKIAQITPEATASTFEPTLKAYPNPFTERLSIEFNYETDTKAKLEIYSVTGAKLQTLYDGPVDGGQLYTFEYLPRLNSSQVVFYHLTLDGKTHVGKILYNQR